MAQVLVRGLEQEVVDRLKAKARQTGLSLEELARNALRKEAKPSREEVLAEIDRIRALTPKRLDSSVRLIREARDADDIGS